MSLFVSATSGTYLVMRGVRMVCMCPYSVEVAIMGMRPSNMEVYSGTRMGM